MIEPGATTMFTNPKKPTTSSIFNLWRAIVIGDGHKNTSKCIPTILWISNDMHMKVDVNLIWRSIYYCSAQNVKHKAYS